MSARYREGVENVGPDNGIPLDIRTILDSVERADIARSGSHIRQTCPIPSIVRTVRNSLPTVRMPPLVS